MTDHQPDYEQVQDQTDDGLRRAPRTYQRSPRGPMKGRPVIVAIMPGIPKPVLETAVEYAMSMNSKLVFTHVATDRVPSPSNPDASHPLDPTAQRTSMETVKSAIHSALDAFMSDYPKADWELVYLSGLPDQQLAHLAHTIGAGCFILGTRRPGLRAGLQEWLDGSVAVQLGRRQLRPVIVVPLRSEDWEHPFCQ